MLSTFLSGLRSIAFVSTFTAIQMVALTLVPVTFLNPILRVFGVSERLLPMNIVLPQLARVVLFFSGVWVEVDNRATKFDGTRTIFMYNHTSNLDPVIVQSVVATKFVYKKELSMVPIFGWVLYLYNNVSIDRKDRKKAIESLNAAVKRVVDKNQSVAISPEGTRSKSGELQEFKKGPFHLARQAKARIVPVVIEGAHALLPPKSVLLSGGCVRVTLLEPIEVEDSDVDELRERLHHVFDQQIRRGRERPMSQSHPLVTAAPALSLVALAGMFVYSKIVVL
jgi:1-acyl-sn-glycerol-3-phosphate acyltransferase